MEKTARRYIFRERAVIKFIVLILCIFQTGIYRIYAQETNKGLPGKHLIITLSGKISLDSLTAYVDHHSNVRFSFNSRKIKGNREIPFEKGSYTLHSLLQHIRQATGLYYIVYKDHIIFQDNPPRPHNPKPPLVYKQKMKAGPRAGSGTDIHKPVKVSNDESQSATGTQPHKDTTTASVVAEYRDSTRRIPSVSDSLKPAKDYKNSPASRTLKKDSNAKSIPRFKPDKSFSHPNWHLQAGISGSDVLYFNPGIEVGINPIHLIIGWTTDFGRAHAIRIGLGTILLNRDNMQLQLLAGFSPLRTIHWIDTALLSNWWVSRGQLYDLTLWWCGKLGPHWMVKAGPTFNVLETAYSLNSVNGQSINPSGVYIAGDPDKHLALLHIPLVLFNTFNVNRPDNVRGWIGLSAGIYYTLPF